MYDPTWMYAWEIFISSNRDIKFDGFIKSILILYIVFFIKRY